MKAHVTGIGWVGAAGMGRAGDGSRFDLPAGSLPPVRRRDVFPDPYPRFGRLDPFSRLGVAAVALALRDAGLEAWEHKRPVGIVAATAYGCLATDVDYYDTVMPDGGRLASPQLFAYTLPNCFLGDAAIRFGLTGPSWVVLEQEPSGLAAVTMALELIGAGEVDAVLAGRCDLGRPEALGSEPGGPEGSGALGGPPGAVFLVLEKSPRGGTAARGVVGLAAGGAVTCGSRPAGDLAGLVRACLAGSRAASG